MKADESLDRESAGAIVRFELCFRRIHTVISLPILTTNVKIILEPKIVQIAKSINHKEI